MKDFFTQFKTIARTTRLSHDEKQVMRVQLYNYLESNQGFEAASVAARTNVPRTFGRYSWFTPSHAMQFAAVLLVVFSGGTAFAAQGALPGDALYSVKINVNEAVRSALATTPAAKAQVEASLATNRLEEAETLASNGKLDAAKAAQLATNFEQHAAVAQATAVTLESNDPGTAAKLGAEFDGALSAHGAILTLLGGDSTDAETTHNSNQLAIQVQNLVRSPDEDSNATENANAAVTLAIASDTSATADASPANTRIRTLAAVAPQAEPMTLSATNSASSTPVAAKTSAAKVSVQTMPAPAPVTKDTQKDIQTAAKLGTQASSSLSAAAKRFADLQRTLGSGTAALISTQLAAAQGLFVAANTSLSEGDTTSARDGFTRVLRISSKLDAYIKAGKKLNVTILSSLIDNSGAQSAPSISTEPAEAHKGEH